MVIYENQLDENSKQKQVVWEDLLNKLKKIKIRTFCSLTFAIFNLISYIVIIASGGYLVKINNDNLINNISTSIIINWVFSILSFVGTIICFILNIINAVQILKTNWNHDIVNNNKFLWGIFTIFFLGWIASLVFVIQSQKIYKKELNIISF